MHRYKHVCGQCITSGLAIPRNLLGHGRVTYSTCTCRGKYNIIQALSARHIWTNLVPRLSPPHGVRAWKRGNIWTSGTVAIGLQNKLCKRAIAIVFKMTTLKYVWLLCTWLTLRAAPLHPPGHGYSRYKRQLEQIRLDFTLFSNSTTDCSAGLSNRGVSVTVSYRTFTGQGSSEWTSGGQIFRTPDAVCKDR